MTKEEFAALVDAFDDAARVWGWEQDQGHNGLSTTEARVAHAETKDALSTAYDLIMREGRRVEQEAQRRRERMTAEMRQKVSEHMNTLSRRISAKGN